jgi:SAM-dependent methyltransferase
MASDHLSPEAIAAHDRQRILPAAAQEALIAGLASRLRGFAPCLDAGAGTGMITIPLARAGIELVALDLSPAMLDVLRARLKPGDPVRVIEGDLRDLPFPDASFGSVIVANVFHLIPEWQRAVGELLRVLRPDRRFLVNLGGGGSLPPELSQVTARFWELYPIGHGGPSERRGLQDAEEFDAFMTDQGMEALPPLEIAYDTELTARTVIDRLEHNVFARPGDAGSARDAAEATRAWARETLGSLDRSFPRTQRIVYRCYG